MNSAAAPYYPRGLGEVAPNCTWGPPKVPELFESGKSQVLQHRR